MKSAFCEWIQASMSYNKVFNAELSVLFHAVIVLWYLQNIWKRVLSFTTVTEASNEHRETIYDKDSIADNKI